MEQNELKTTMAPHCLERLQLGIRGMHHLLAFSLLWLDISRLSENCSCLMASGIGVVELDLPKCLAPLVRLLVCFGVHYAL